MRIVDFAYNATFVDNHDGDTMSVVVDFGFRTFKGATDSPHPIRLAGIAARELKDEGGKEARDHLAKIMHEFSAGPELGLYTAKPYKYGDEWAAMAMFRDLGGRLVPLNQLLVVCGFAVAWDGKGSQPQPVWPRRSGCVHTP